MSNTFPLVVHYGPSLDQDGNELPQDVLTMAHPVTGDPEEFPVSHSRIERVLVGEEAQEFAVGDVDEDTVVAFITADEAASLERLRDAGDTSAFHDRAADLLNAYNAHD